MMPPIPVLAMLSRENCPRNIRSVCSIITHLVQNPLLSREGQTTPDFGRVNIFLERRLRSGRRKKEKRICGQVVEPPCEGDKCNAENQPDKRRTFLIIISKSDHQKTIPTMTTTDSDNSGDDNDEDGDARDQQHSGAGRYDDDDNEGCRFASVSYDGECKNAFFEFYQ